MKAWGYPKGACPKLMRITIDLSVLGLIAVACVFAYHTFAIKIEGSPPVEHKHMNCPACGGTGDNPDPAKYPGQTRANKLPVLLRWKGGNKKEKQG